MQQSSRSEVFLVKFTNKQVLCGNVVGHESHFDAPSR